jgi:hypothetical protein
VLLPPCVLVLLRWCFAREICNAHVCNVLVTRQVDQTFCSVPIPESRSIDISLSHAVRPLRFSHSHETTQLQSASISVSSLCRLHQVFPSASSLSLFIRFSIRFFPLLRRQSLLGLIFRTEPRCAQSRSLSLARWISLIRMKDSYAQMRESTESISASSLSLSSAF